MLGIKLARLTVAKVSASTLVQTFLKTAMLLNYLLFRILFIYTQIETSISFFDDDHFFLLYSIEIQGLHLELLFSFLVNSKTDIIVK